MKELPEGWEFSTLQELGLPKSTTIDPKAFPDETFELYSVPSYSYLTPEIVKGSGIGSAKQLVQPGDVLLCKIVPHLVRVWVVPERKNLRQIASGEWILIRSSLCNAGYIRRLLMDPYFREKFMETVSGVGGSLLRARPKAVSQIPIPIAPSKEQRRIVAKLDRLFERTRRAREELSHIPRLIENYKKAILAAAFRGDLTKDWRISHCRKITKDNARNIDARCYPLADLPSPWVWSSINSVSFISGGLTKNARRREMESKVPYLRVANVYANELRLEDVQEIGCTHLEYEKTRLIAGDLLIVEGNGSIDQIGRVAMWDGSISKCSHQNHLIRVRAKENVTSEYLLYWLLSPLGRQYIEKIASSSSGLHTLSISKISNLPLPICSIEEMNKITDRIKSCFLCIEACIKEAIQASHLLDHLDQVHLAKAFRGELVPQDPSDEPASALLERIRAARAGQPKIGHKQR